jgi:hypothetical protein
MSSITSPTENRAPEGTRQNSSHNVLIACLQRASKKNGGRKMSKNTARAPEIAQKLIQNGFRVVPLPRGEKGPKISKWPEREFDEDDFEVNGGVGIKTGNGTVAIDIDCYGPDIVESIVAEFERRFGRTFRRTVMSDNHLGRCRQPPWPVGLDGRRACPSGGQPHRPD